MVARPVERARAAGFRGARERLVETLREKGIRDLSVLRAIEMTPRHAFVPTGLRHRAYEDAPLPIGNGQTISQPWVHARYLELLELTGNERVLEIGTGSGYQTVLLAHLVGAGVLDRADSRAVAAGARGDSARRRRATSSLLLGDGTVGWREYAPYDAILVGAGAPSVPQPLVDQLAEGGRLLIPIGDRDEQKLDRCRNERAAVSSTTRDRAPCGSCRCSARTAGAPARVSDARCTSSCAAGCRASGFAGSFARQLGALGLAGWVRNQPDGSVEVAAEGDDDPAIQSLRRALAHGPPARPWRRVDELAADRRLSLELGHSPF